MLQQRRLPTGSNSPLGAAHTPTCLAGHVAQLVMVGRFVTGFYIDSQMSGGLTSAGGELMSGGGAGMKDGVTFEKCDRCHSYRKVI